MQLQLSLQKATPWPSWLEEGMKSLWIIKEIASDIEPTFDANWLKIIKNSYNFLANMWELFDSGLMNMALLIF